VVFLAGRACVEEFETGSSEKSTKRRNGEEAAGKNKTKIFSQVDVGDEICLWGKGGTQKKRKGREERRMPHSPRVSSANPQDKRKRKDCNVSTSFCLKRRT